MSTARARKARGKAAAAARWADHERHGKVLLAGPADAIAALDALAAADGANRSAEVWALVAAEVERRSLSRSRVAKETPCFANRSEKSTSLRRIDLALTSIVCDSYLTMTTRNEWAARPNRESLTKRLGKVAKRIAARDGHACVYCGATAKTSGAHLHLDHIIPRVAGGEDIATNLVIACRSCNSRRHDMPLPAWCRLVGVDVRRIRRQVLRALPELKRAA